MLQEIFKGRETAFTRLLDRDGPVLLDGGLATQLEAQGCDIGNRLWSASLLQAAPEAIVGAHGAYIEAGAQCLATASYQASRAGFAALGLNDEEADELMRLSVRLAREARDASQSDLAIAASLGPYGAMLHDGSEYRGDYGVTSGALRKFHLERLHVFDVEKVDVLALETIPSYQEAEVLADLLADCDAPSWVSFSCQNESEICDGTPISKAAALFASHSKVVAVGINCTPPQYLPALLGQLRQAVPNKYRLAYPNSGEVYNVADNSWSGTVTPGDCADAAIEWIEAGAKLVGGCCRMGPQHIAAMGAKLKQLR